MGNRVTLGGERLGSGKKMKVELPNYGRSTHDLGYLWRSTMAAGTVVPFMAEVVLPGDSVDINLNAKVLTHPTVGPVFGTMKVEFHVFLADLRLYQGRMHNDPINAGRDVSRIKLPQYTMLAPTQDPVDGIYDVLDNTQINPSSILAYLGQMGIGIKNEGLGDGKREFNAHALLAYYDLCKNYYANKQEEKAYIIHTQYVAPTENIDEIRVGTSVIPAGTAGNVVALGPGTIIEMDKLTEATDWQVYITTKRIELGTELTVLNVRDLGTIIEETDNLVRISYNWAKYGTIFAQYWRYGTQTDLKTEINLTGFPLENIDKMRERILAAATDTSPFNVTDQNLAPYNLIFDQVSNWRAIMGSQEGLFLKTYNSDLFNNWLNTEWIDGPGGISEITSIDTTAGSFTMDALLIQRKVYDMLNNVAVSGGTLGDWQMAVYDVERFGKSEIPVFIGGMSQELVFDEVISNNSTANEGNEKPLGTLAGRGKLAGERRGGHISTRVNEHAMLIGVAHITPRLDYSQGNEWWLHLESLADYHVPAMDEIGFQELITEQMAWWDTHQNGANEWVQKSAGKQPAWINYMTNVNRVKGNFAIQDNEDFMVFIRRYEPMVSGVTWTIKDLTTYIDPSKFNHIFADTALDAQNFWMQIGVDMTMRRKMSSKVMPRL